MSKCILCLNSVRESKTVKLTDFVSENLTFQDAIEQQIQCNVLPFSLSTNTDQTSCKTCFNAFKSFYQFIAKIKPNLTSIKTENFIEIPTENPSNIQFPHEMLLKQEPPHVVLDRIKCEPEYTAYSFGEFDMETTEAPVNEDSCDFRGDSDFEWSYDDPMDSMSHDDDGKKKKSKRVKKKPGRFDDFRTSTSRASESKQTEGENSIKIELNPDAVALKPAKAPSSSYIRYLPREKVTQEMIDSGQDFIVIDGIEYKIPRRKWLAKKQFKKYLNKIERDDDLLRQKGSLNDPEGDERIRQEVDMKCYVCSAQFDTFIRVKKHMRLFHPKERIYVLCCGRKFRRRFELLEHIECHDKTIIHSCTICNKIYKNKNCLRTHMKFYHPADDSAKVICDECGKLFNNELLLKAHMLTHFVDSTKTFECYICKEKGPKTFKNVIQVKNHLRAHHTANKKNIMTVCHVCSSTIRQSYLPYHMKTLHGGLTRERVKCEICSSWVLETTLRVHMAKHSDMGINCKVCGKFLKSSFSLTTHMKQAHSGDYKFKCEYCGKGFFKQLKMQEHVAVKHTREFLFKCRVDGCDRQFRAEANWRNHEKKYHPEEYDKLFKPFYKRNPQELQEFTEMMEARGGI